ncbi:hypothetical protein [Jiangella alkaliphila]|uniref:Holin n=1 Tax=Jiangella alkaliphila TaxID=419479 RepID=A0A1H2IFF7_9ACTN|nr:hypothetical protein [Jiangella alkaliphila]SDU42857.1 hypothetical protein SAMN04488563_1675 [Jiangella alkaliphila]
MSSIAPYAKAVAGGVVGGLTALGTALTDGAVTPAEWVAVALGFMGGLGIVYVAPSNRQSL